MCEILLRRNWSLLGELQGVAGQEVYTDTTLVCRHTINPFYLSIHLKNRIE
jgi:hypothetical protein